MSKQKRESAQKSEVISVFQLDDSSQTSIEPSWFGSLKSNWRRKILYPFAGLALLALITMGVMAKNNWLPSTDAVTGVKTGWFGSVLPRNASSSWNPMAAPLPTPTPQLSKEYIYAGSRMLAVEDANASAAPPADLAIWRPSNGEWWVMGGTGSQQTAIQWGSGGGSGTPSDQTAPGDYDGDGKTDFAVFRESTGTWYIVNSSTGDSTQTYYFFGSTGDKVAPADFDGDGKTDAALYRPSTGKWYIQYSTSSQVVESPFGLSSDIPTPGDFDGDGKADRAVFRASDSTFYIHRTSTDSVQIITMPNAVNTDRPVPGDYDGDGKADAAVRRGTNWHILQSSNNNSETIVPSFGFTTDTAVQNDYDGDGKVDIAVWRGQSNVSSEIGYWYIRQSSNNQVRQTQWGIAGDIPVPAFFRR
jgi:hypothetical protein